MCEKKNLKMLWHAIYAKKDTRATSTDQRKAHSTPHSYTFKNSIAFGKSTSQRIYREQHVPKIGWKLHKYGLKHALHTLDGHFR